MAKSKPTMHKVEVCGVKFEYLLGISTAAIKLEAGELLRLGERLNGSAFQWFKPLETKEPHIEVMEFIKARLAENSFELMERLEGSTRAA